MARRQFFLISPIILLFAFGVFVKSTKTLLPSNACSTADFSGSLRVDTAAIFENQNLFAPSMLAFIDREKNTRVLGVASPTERWIEIDLSEQKLYAWDGDKLFLETPISSGLAHTPTPTGEFRVWIKLRSTKMEGGEGAYYYYLPNVPYVMYFGNDEVPGWKGYGIHGTYWHDDFGTPRSHGCVNTPTPIAEKLYYWSTPILTEGKNTVYSDEENPGIKVIIHE